MAALSGRTIGKYRIGRLIGEGGMGSVFLGIDTVLGRQVAVKILHGHLSRSPDVVERFRNEAVTQARLQHPHIVTLHDFVLTDDIWMIAMEYVVGGRNLGDVVREGPMPQRAACEVLRRVLGAVAFAHGHRIIHRDLKPANILIQDEGGRPWPKLTDFGIAKFLHAGSMTKPGSVLGTVDYMSPEQCVGSDGIDERTDLYSLGVVFYECLTGRPPFRGGTDYQVMRAHVDTPPVPPHLARPDLLPGVVSVCMRALEKDAGKRCRSAKEMLGDLDSAWPEIEKLADESVPLPPARVQADDRAADAASTLLAGGTGRVAAGSAATDAARAPTGPRPRPAEATVTIGRADTAPGADGDVFPGPRTERPVSTALTHVPGSPGGPGAVRTRARRATPWVIGAIAVIAAATAVLARNRIFGGGGGEAAAGDAGVEAPVAAAPVDPIRAMMDSGRLEEAVDAAVANVTDRPDPPAADIEVLGVLLERSASALPPESRLRAGRALERALIGAAGRRPPAPESVFDAALRAGTALVRAGAVGSATGVVAAASAGGCDPELAAAAFAALADGVRLAGGFDEASGVVRFLSAVPAESPLYLAARRALGAAKDYLVTGQRAAADDALRSGRWADAVAAFERLRKDLGDSRESANQLELRARDLEAIGPSGLCVPVGLARVRDPAAASRNVGRPQIAWTGSEYLVVWSDGRAAPENSSVQNVLLQRLDATGVRLEAADKEISPPGSDARRPSIDFYGKHCGVVWYDTAPGGRRIVFAPIDFLGNPTGPATTVGQASTGVPFPAVALARSQSAPAAAVVWQDRETLVPRRSPGGDLAWMRAESRSDASSSRAVEREVAIIAFLDETGAVVDGPRVLERPPEAVPVPASGPPRGLARPPSTRLPDVAGAGEGFLAAWEEERDGGVTIVAALFGPAGGEPRWVRAVLPGDGGGAPVEGRMPAALADAAGGRVAVLWVDRKPSPDLLHVSTLDFDGNPLADAVAARGPVRYLQGAINGDTIAASWWTRGRPSQFGLVPCTLGGSSCVIPGGDADTPGGIPLVGADGRVGLAPGAGPGEVVAVWKEKPGAAGIAEGEAAEEMPSVGDEIFFVRFRCAGGEETAR